MARSGKQKRVVFTPIRGYLVAVKMEIPARNVERVENSKGFEDLSSFSRGWMNSRERERTKTSDSRRGKKQALIKKIES